MEYLRNVGLNKALKIREGVFVHNYRDLLIQLRMMSDFDFRQRFGDGCEIVKWLEANFKDEKLLFRIELVNTRREFARVLEKRINQLHDEGVQKKADTKIAMPFYVNVVFFLVFVAVVLSFLRYAYLNDEDSRLKYREMNEELQRQSQHYIDRIIFLESQNLRMKEELEAKNIIELETGIPSPTDRIQMRDIEADNAVVLVKLDNSYLSQFTDTDSMLPVLDSGAVGIEVIPQNESEIFGGDIISYKLSDGSVVIHRVMFVGNDSQGWYAVTKGDNNPFQDRDPVRFSQITGILVGILY